ncbi:O-antigen polysaccharide polymerase Wzy, partial [Adlercreutzia sp. R25]|uniref:O-antigen polysaccharide polymerase Wzy n=1 Tax=Adlercreutzia shanghongiae TaxID=3111773 RepID=UPI002DBF46A5
QQLLMALDVQPSRIYIDLASLSASGVWRASLVVLLCMLVLTVFYCFSLGASKRPKGAGGSVGLLRNRNALRSSSVIVALVVLVPTLITLYRNYSMLSTVGYGARVTGAAGQVHGIANACGILSELMPYALLGILVTKKEGEKWPIVALLGYIFLYMMTGSRTTGFILLVTTAVVWFALFSKDTKNRQLLKIVIGGVAIAGLFSFVSLLRGALEPSQAGGSLADLLVGNNVFIESLAEAGQTFVVLGSVVEHCPAEVPFGNGATYFSGITYVLPNGLTGNYYESIDSVDELFSPFVTQYSGVGSSFIAEAYYNFGYGSLAVMAIYGIILGRLQSAFDRAIERKNYGAIFAIASSFAIISFCVRSDVRTFLRTFVWSVSPILLLNWLLCSKEEEFELSAKSLRDIGGITAPGDNRIN